jgi:hypothetical protein
MRSLGILIGRVIKIRNKFLYLKLYLVKAKAAGIPKKAENSDVPAATLILLTSAGQITLLSNAARYQSRVNPCKGKTPVTFLLKDKTISMQIGINIKNKTIIEYIFRKDIL